MPDYRVRMTIEIEIQLNDVDSEIEAFRIADGLSMRTMAKRHWMINKQIDVRGEAKPQEQERCGICDSMYWDDYKGCAACGNLNPEWMG